MTILQETRQYAEGIFSTKLNPSFVFHNAAHTEGVVRACEEMADYYQLSDEDRLVLLLAAWFHDTGYSYGEAEKHEEASMAIARQFLQRIPSLSPALTERVVAAIAATRMPQSPANLIGEILCDADLSHLGTGDFKTRSKLLRKEINGSGKTHYDKEEWNAKNIEFLRSHRYFTSYGRERLEPVKQSNLQELEGKYPVSPEKSDHGVHTGKDLPEISTLAETDGHAGEVGLSQVRPGPISSPADPVEEPGRKAHKKGDKGKKDDAEKTDKADKSDKSDKAEKSERGITTTFRITSSNHSNLSHMADNKAHILISVNSIIISIIISLLIRHLQDHHNLIIPTTILMFVSVITMVFAILATRPNVSHGIFTAEDVKNRKVNLLFFGNFFNMSVTEYGEAMKEMIGDRNYMYDNIIKDIYYQGIVLARKYKYLRIAYTIFMYGIIVSVLAFSITMFYI